MDKGTDDFTGQPFSMKATRWGTTPTSGGRAVCTGRIYSEQIASGNSVALLKQRDPESSDELLSFQATATPPD